MSDREKTLERQMFQYLSKRGDSDRSRISLHQIFNTLFKSNGLLISAAFINGKLVTIDELRRVAKLMAGKEWITLWDTLNDAYVSLTDLGVIELNKRLADGEDFDLSADDISSQRWGRLKAITINGGNAAQISNLIDRSLDELGRHPLSNEQHRQAASYMLAAKELVNAPAPPSEVIWDLIQKAAAIAGLVQFILPIFANLI